MYDLKCTQALCAAEVGTCKIDISRRSVSMQNTDKAN